MDRYLVVGIVVVDGHRTTRVMYNTTIVVITVVDGLRLQTWYATAPIHRCNKSKTNLWVRGGKRVNTKHDHVDIIFETTIGIHAVRRARIRK